MLIDINIGYNPSYGFKELLNIGQFKFFTALFTLILITGCRTFEKQDRHNFINENIKTFKYEDSFIKYSESGSGDTILFVHGLGSSSFTWRYLYEYYSKTHHVISLDLKGFGDSSKPIDKKYRISDQGKMIHSFILDKGLNNLTLVGNSFGGAVVLSTYLIANKDMKNRISNLILLDPAAYAQEEFPGYVKLLRTPFFNKFALVFGSKNFIAHYVLKQIVYDDDIITDEMVLTYSSYLHGKQSHNALIETAKNLSSTETKEMSKNYNTIDIPVLIIWGEFDEVIDKSTGEKLHQEIMNSKLVIIDNCGHVPQEEFPDKTIEIINDFIIF